MKEKVFEHIYEFPFDEISKLETAKSRRGQKKKGKTYINAIAAFDIETTKIPGEDVAVMFIWQFHIMTDEFNYTVLARTWDDFEAFMILLEDAIGDRTLLIFDHNFNYEFNYLKSIIKFTNKDGFTEIFSKDPHHPIYAMSHEGHFEWRDSYSLFCTSLKEATKGLPHAKIDGEDFDYTKKRFYWTPLTDIEKQYCINDVYGLCEAVKRNMDDYNDSLYSIPLTSTGYIRRDIKRIMYNHTRFNDFPADEFGVYKLLVEGFRGGNTHANRFIAGLTLDDVASYDRSSSYPDVMVNDKFPIKPFVRSYNTNLWYLDHLHNNGYAFLVKMRINNCKLKDKLEPLPYQSVSKCFYRVGLGQEDNGRLMEIDQCEIVFTDVDWYIFSKQYDGEFKIKELWVSEYGYLPDEIRNYIIELYKAKTALKGVKGSEDKYRVSKTKINGCFGLSVQRIENKEIYFDESELELVENKAAIFDEETYYNTTKRRPMPYRWGVWVAAWGRFHLQKAIDIVGADFCYGDTDSCKSLGNYDKEFEELNKFYIKRSTESGAYATDPKGKVHYMGVYEKEGVYDHFITMGSKKYGSETDGELEITIAGVPKVEGSKELEEAGGLSAFKPGMIFNAGKLRPVYNDKDNYGTRTVYDCYGNTGTVKVTSNVCLVDVQYKLGYSDEYEDLLDNLDDLIENQVDIASKYQKHLDDNHQF